MWGSRSLCSGSTTPPWSTSSLVSPWKPPLQVFLIISCKDLDSLKNAPQNSLNNSQKKDRDSLISQKNLRINMLSTLNYGFADLMQTFGDVCLFVCCGKREATLLSNWISAMVREASDISNTAYQIASGGNHHDFDCDCEAVHDGDPAETWILWILECEHTLQIGTQFFKKPILYALIYVNLQWNL